MAKAAKLGAIALLVAAVVFAWFDHDRRPDADRPHLVPSSDDSLPDAASPLKTATTESAARVAEPAAIRVGSDAWLTSIGAATTPVPEHGLPIKVIVASTRAPAVGVAVFV